MGGVDDLPIPPDRLSESARVFYDDQVSIADKRSKLHKLAEAGDAEARGYLGSLLRVERSLAMHVEALIQQLATEMGRQLPSRCDEAGIGSINERDQLQPWSAEVLRGLAAETSRVTAATSVKVGTDQWPRLGPVDLALLPAGPPPTFLELKCGSAGDALGPCSWDVVKLAFLLRAGECSAAYLVAATTKELWSKPLRGAEFFGDAEVWSTAEIRERYEDWFRSWEREGYLPPAEVPAAGQTSAVTTVEFEIAGHPWELRVARVDADADDVVQWEPLLGQD